MARDRTRSANLSIPGARVSEARKKSFQKSHFVVTGRTKPGRMLMKADFPQPPQDTWDVADGDGSVIIPPGEMTAVRAEL